MLLNCISCVAEASAAAVDESEGSAPGESVVIALSRVLRGRGRGCSIPPVTAASQALAFNRTRTREVRPAARMDA